jgi:hypothetical protein
LLAFSTLPFHVTLELGVFEIQGVKFMSKKFWILSLGILSAAPLTNATITKNSLSLQKIPQEIQPFSKSLLFDQSFDKKPLRPLITQEIIKRYLASQERSAENLASVEVSPKVEEPLIEKIAPPVEAIAASIKKEDPKPTENPALSALEIGHPMVLEKVEPEALPAKALLGDLHKKGEIKIESRLIEKPKTLDSKSAALFVLDETSFLEGRYERVPGAKVHWLHPKSGLSSETDKEGRARIPYPQAHSARYVVTAQGYIPAVGYAVRGILSPVLLYRESRIGPILKSLNLAPKPNEHILLGKFLSRQLNSMDRMSLDDFIQDSRKSFYSSGRLGIFNPFAKESGPGGDFLIAHLPTALQYLLPKQALNEIDVLEWPAQLIDLKGLMPIMTTTVLEHKDNQVSTRVVDAFTGERPESGIYASIGGQRGVIEPDINGFIDLNDMPLRPNVDLVEIYAQGYMKSWINSPSRSETLPDTVPLFSQTQLSQVLAPVGEEVLLSKSYIVGGARTNSFDNNVRLKLYNSLGQVQRSAQVYYFSKNGMLSKNQDFLDLRDPRFVITNVPDGEYHIVAIDAQTGHGVGIQVLRTQAGTISHVQF